MKVSSIRELVQSTLDTAMAGAVQVHWQRKSGPDADEYIIYTMSGDSDVVFGDNAPLAEVVSVTVRYYYRDDKIDTPDGRSAVETREQDIKNAMKAAGFGTSGKIDAGDIDDIGFLTSVWECSYWRLI
jgi:hypothetical protein